MPAQPRAATKTRARVVVSRRIFPELLDPLRADFDLVSNQEDEA
jgi:hypothetical protein